MKRLVFKQFLPIDIETAWNYFSTPNNLNEITPPDMVFDIVSEVPDQMYEGMFISYELSPFLNLRMQWVTEITHIKPSHFFVDEQRKGPYRIWHHEHHFEEHEGGVLMTDILHYDIGKSIFGALAGYLFVHRKVRSIFEYRRMVLVKKFGGER